MQRTRKDISLKNTEMTNKYMKMCSTSLITREMQIKTTMRCHLTPQNRQRSSQVHALVRRKMQRKLQETGRECPGRLIRALAGLPLRGNDPSLSKVFSYCSWGSQGKNSGGVCHSLHQWATFGQTSPPRLVRTPIHLGWPYTAWLIILLH